MPAGSGTGSRANTHIRHPVSRLRIKAVPADFVIRAPREGESAEIADLLRACFADEGPEIGGRVDTPESVATLQQSGNHLLTMGVGGRIVGFIYLDPLRKAAFKLAVHPSFRGMNHGQRLME